MERGKRTLTPRPASRVAGPAPRNSLQSDVNPSTRSRRSVGMQVNVFDQEFDGGLAAGFNSACVGMGSFG
jgi:hypothetical protein